MFNLLEEIGNIVSNILTDLGIDFTIENETHLSVKYKLPKK